MNEEKKNCEYKIKMQGPIDELESGQRMQKTIIELKILTEVRDGRLWSEETIKAAERSMLQNIVERIRGEVEVAIRRADPFGHHR